MSKPFHDLRTDEEAGDWLQNADLTEYDLSDMKKAPFELAPRTPPSASASLLATLKTSAAEANMPTQWFSRVLIEAQLRAGMEKRKGSRSRPRGRRRED